MSGTTRKWAWALIAALGLGLAGCGDSNVFEGEGDEDSTQARKEAGVEAINDGQWDEAIAIFSDLHDAGDPDADVVKYLASAYVGKAGFNTLKLVGDIAEAQEQDGADGQSVVYDSVTRLFDTDGDGVISQDDLTGEDGKLTLLTEAIRVLLPAYGGAGRFAAAASGPTDQQRFQAGLYAAVHAVLSVVGQIEDPRGTGNLLLTLDELTLYADEVIPGVVAPATLEDDLQLVSDAKDVLLGQLADDLDGEQQNDIAEEFDAFLTDIGFLGGDTPSDVTDQELQDYLRSLLDLLPREAASEVAP